MNTKNDKEDGGKKAARCDINVPLIVPASAALEIAELSNNASNFFLNIVLKKCLEKSSEVFI